MVKIEELPELLKTQDNRSTADPIYVVYDIERIVVPADNHYDGMFWFWGDGDGHEFDEVYDWHKFCLDNCYEGFHPEMELDELEKKAEDMGLQHLAYVERRVFTNVFLTEKGAKDFIKANHYHFTRLHVYVHSLWRNEEMQAVRKFFLEKGGSSNNGN